MTQRAKRLAAVVPEAEDAGRANGSPEPSLDRNIQARIGDNLRAMYDGLLQQPVPDRFRDLLGQLEQQKGSKEQNR
jgi:hypothetical protein